MCVTVELKSCRVTDEESDQAAWQVIVSGGWGDTTHGAWTDRAYAHSEATHLYELLGIVLGEGQVKLELP